MAVWSDLIGTVKSVLRVGFRKAVIDASGLSGEHTFTLPDKAGTFALLDDVAAVQDEVDAIVEPPRLHFWLSL